MNSEEDEFKRIEREALRRAAQDDDDTQVYTSDVALAEAYRCGFEAGAVAEREACAKVCEQPIDEIQITDDCSEVRYMDGKECADAIRARGNT